MKKKLLVLLGSSLLVLALALIPFLNACAPEEVTPPPEEGPSPPVVSEWNIPQISMLTGPPAIFGLAAVWGADMAVKEINEAGGIRGVPIKLTRYDSAYDPAKAVTMMARAIEGSLVILGPLAQEEGEPAGEIAVSEGVTFISELPNPLARESFAPWGCCWSPDNAPLYAVGVREWLRLNPDIKSVAIAYVPEFPSHVSSVKYTEIELERLGVEVAGYLEATFGQIDMGPLAVKALDMDADGYYSILNEAEQGKLSVEMYQRGMTEGRRICCGCFTSGTLFYDIGEGFLEDTYIWDCWDMGYEDPTWQNIVEAYKADHEGELPWISIVPGFYDAVYAIKAAFEACEITGDPAKLAEERIKIRDFLYNTPFIHGAQGDWRWVNGKKEKPLYMFQIKDNWPQLVCIIPPEEQ